MKDPLFAIGGYVFAALAGSLVAFGSYGMATFCGLMAISAFIHSK